MCAFCIFKKVVLGENIPQLTLAAICRQRSDIGRRKKSVTDSLGEFINEKQIIKKIRLAFLK